ncbi:unnamed protein product [Sphagnum tenellum]
MFQSTLSSKPVYPKPVLHKYENAVVDYVVEGSVTLRAAGGVHFKKFVVLLTNGYKPPSTRTILRRITELTGVSKRVGTALFEYLKRLGRDVVTRLFNVVSDNGLDVITIITRLF